MAKQPQRRTNMPTSAASKRPAAPSRKAPNKSRSSWFFRGDEPFTFGRRNFIVMGIGLLLVVLGLLAMSGGAMPDPETWDPNLIYSPRRITLAPFLMVAGFVTVIVGIFIDSPDVASANPTSSDKA